MSELPAHSPLGPSSAERWLNCPASVRATAGLPDTDSTYALEGTAAHTLSEWCRQNDRPAKEYPASPVMVTRVDGKVIGIEATSEMREAVQEFVDYVNAVEGEQLCETRVRYQKYVPNGWGTLDAAVMREGYATIIDLKYGQGVQKYAEKNEQLMLYALGVFLDWDWLYRFRKFKLVVHQPRLDHVDEWEIHAGDLLIWAKEVLVPGYLRTQDPRSTFNPGKTQCQFCKIKATCKARAESVFAAVVDEFDDLNKAMVQVAAPTQPGITLTNEQIAKALEAKPNALAWFSAVEAHAIREIMQGRVVGDFKLVEGRSDRKWGAEETAIVPALTAAGAVEGDLFTRKLISPAAAEKLVGKKFFAPATEKKPAGELAVLIVKPPGRPKLAPGSDKRAALTIDALAQFDDITEEGE